MIIKRQESTFFIVEIPLSSELQIILILQNITSCRLMMKSHFSIGTCYLINNGNRTEWSPIRSVIIRVINKIGRLCSWSLICLMVTSMMADRIGRNEVLLPISHNYNTIYDVLTRLKVKSPRNSKSFLASSEKRTILVHARWCVLSDIT